MKLGQALLVAQPEIISQPGLALQMGAHLSLLEIVRLLRNFRLCLIPLRPCRLRIAAPAPCRDGGRREEVGPKPGLSETWFETWWSIRNLAAPHEDNVRLRRCLLKRKLSKWNRWRPLKKKIKERKRKTNAFFHRPVGRPKITEHGSCAKRRGLPSCHNDYLKIAKKGLF